jgi:hypothetical protein
MAAVLSCADLCFCSADKAAGDTAAAAAVQSATVVPTQRTSSVAPGLQTALTLSGWVGGATASAVKGS